MDIDIKTEIQLAVGGPATLTERQTNALVFYLYTCFLQPSLAKRLKRKSCGFRTRRQSRSAMFSS